MDKKKFWKESLRLARAIRAEDQINQPDFLRPYFERLEYLSAEQYRKIVDHFVSTWTMAGSYPLLSNFVQMAPEKIDLKNPKYPEPAGILSNDDFNFMLRAIAKKNGLEYCKTRRDEL